MYAPVALIGGVEALLERASSEEELPLSVGAENPVTGSHAMLTAEGVDDTEPTDAVAEHAWFGVSSGKDENMQ